MERKYDALDGESRLSHFWEKESRVDRIIDTYVGISIEPNELFFEVAEANAKRVRVLSSLTTLPRSNVHNHSYNQRNKHQYHDDELVYSNRRIASAYSLSLGIFPILRSRLQQRRRLRR